MGNQICACDKESSEANAPEMSIQRRPVFAAEKAIVRDSSMAKLMVPVDTTPHSTAKPEPKLEDT